MKGRVRPQVLLARKDMINFALSFLEDKLICSIRNSGGCCNYFAYNAQKISKPLSRWSYYLTAHTVRKNGRMKFNRNKMAAVCRRRRLFVAIQWRPLAGPRCRVAATNRTLMAPRPATTEFGHLVRSQLMGGWSFSRVFLSRGCGRKTQVGAFRSHRRRIAIDRRD
jgi:hypothetical protein